MFWYISCEEHLYDPVGPLVCLVTVWFKMKFQSKCYNFQSRKCMWVGSWSCGCLVTWFCYQQIAKPGDKTASTAWPDPSLNIVSKMLAILSRPQCVTGGFSFIISAFRISMPKPAWDLCKHLFYRYRIDQCSEHDNHCFTSLEQNEPWFSKSICGNLLFIIVVD